MAKFACLLPRKEMVVMAQRIANELDMEMVVCKTIQTKYAVEEAKAARELGADILVARGRQASILENETDFPIVEIKLTGQEVALLLSRAKRMVSHIARPRIGVVTYPNMIGDIRHFDEALGIELHTYFIQQVDQVGAAAQKAIDDQMDVIIGGDGVNDYCKEHGVLTSFWESTEDSIRSTLHNARNVGFAADAEKVNTAHLQTLLDYSYGGILELDATGVITRTNVMACKILGQEKELLVGMPLSQLMKQEDGEIWEEALAAKKEIYFSAMELGGVDVVVNAAPVKAGDALEGIVFSFYEMRKMQWKGAKSLRERYLLHRYLTHGRFENVNRASREMQMTVKLARTFAETLQPIWLLGEVGSGKTLFAQSIHNISTCAHGPFVPFTCADSSVDELISACKDANGGTLYLNEVERLTIGQQQVMRHVIEDSVVRGKGEEAPVMVQVRVIASSLLDLAEQTANDKFIRPLYYLLASMRLTIPPLRTQPEDLDRAINMCLDDCVTRLNRYVVLTKEARRILLDYPWPGNYIQLRTFLERLALTTPSRTVKDSYVRQLLWELYPASLQSVEEGSGQPVLQPEAVSITAALTKCGGNHAAAASELGISKTTLWRRMKKYAIGSRYGSRR